MEGNQVGRSGRTLKAGIEAENMKECCGMACFPWPPSHGFLSLFSDKTQDHLPRGGMTPSSLGPPKSIINQENAP